MDTISALYQMFHFNISTSKLKNPIKWWHVYVVQKFACSA